MVGGKASNIIWLDDPGHRLSPIAREFLFDGSQATSGKGAGRNHPSSQPSERSDQEVRHHRPFCVIDAKTARVIGLNAAYKQKAGLLEADQVVGKPIQEVVAAGSAARPNKELKDFLESPSDTFHGRAVQLGNKDQENPEAATTTTSSAIYVYTNASAGRDETGTVIPFPDQIDWASRTFYTGHVRVHRFASEDKAGRIVKAFLMELCDMTDKRPLDSLPATLAFPSMGGVAAERPGFSTFDVLTELKTEKQEHEWLASVVFLQWELGSKGKDDDRATGHLDLNEQKLSCFFVTPEGLAEYANELRGKYLPNPYHNWFHALNTMHLTSQFLDGATGIGRRFLDRQEVQMALFAALAHDVGHRGVTNDFELATMSEICNVGKDGKESVLEKYHASQGWAVAQRHLLRRPDGKEGGPTGAGERENEKQMRMLFVRIILATDMIHHERLIGLATELQATLDNGGSFSADSRAKLLEVCVHAADISNPCQTLPIALQWKELILKEFSAQSSREEALGIPLTSHMTGLGDPLKAANSQVTFIKFVVEPLMRDITPLFGLAPYLAAMHANTKYYEQLVAGVEKEAAMHASKKYYEQLVAGKMEEDYTCKYTLLEKIEEDQTSDSSADHVLSKSTTSTGVTSTTAPSSSSSPLGERNEVEEGE
eukprot:g10974.t1